MRLGNERGKYYERRNNERRGREKEIIKRRTKKKECERSMKDELWKEEEYKFSISEYVDRFVASTVCGSEIESNEYVERESTKYPIVE